LQTTGGETMICDTCDQLRVALERTQNELTGVQSDYREMGARAVKADREIEFLTKELAATQEALARYRSAAIGAEGEIQTLRRERDEARAVLGRVQP
jgi:chromosome segregation ATPase